LAAVVVGTTLIVVTVSWTLDLSADWFTGLPRWAGNLTQLAISGILGLVVYGLVAELFRVPELRFIVSVLRRGKRDTVPRAET
jgi:hypothetical protein